MVSKFTPPIEFFTRKNRAAQWHFDGTAATQWHFDGTAAK
jgi:hypothetical protein